MKFSRLMCLFALLFSVAVTAAADSAHLVFTSDTQGHVGPCQSCPGAHGLGSLARRQTLLSQLRKQEKSLLCVDGGDALFGDESMASGGKVIVAAYNALGYDAANISYRDFRLGKEATLAALKDAKFTAISANLVDATTSAPMFEPFVIKQVGNQRVAIVGATESPAALDLLPSLKTQLAGVAIQPPAEALRKSIPKARAQADFVVLVFYGSASSIAPIRSQFGSSVNLILVGGTEASEIPTASAPPMVATFSHGRYVADVNLPPGKPTQILQRAVSGELKPDPAIQKLVASYQTVSQPLTFSSSAPALTTTATAGLPRIDAGKTESLNAVAHNQAVELKVSSVSLLEKLGDAVAPQGRRFLVIDAQFRNLQPPQMVNGQPTPAQYQIPNLADNLYAVANDSQVLHRSAADAGGLLSFGKISLEKQNDAAGGKIVYDVPRDAIPADVKLRFYDFAHGNIVVPILSGAVAPQKPVLPAQHNSVIEAAVYHVEKVPKLGEASAPSGQTFLVVDFRARSTVITRSPAKGFDFHAPPGATLDIGTVCDWKESRKYAQIVVDGQYAYLPQPSSELAEEPRFLPDVMTGGSLTFLIPENCQSIELRCDFPNAKLPDGRVQRPDGLDFVLEGSRPALASRKPIATVNDKVFDVAIVAQQTAKAFAGVAADDGQQFLVLDVTVKDLGKQQEFFQPKEQLKYASESGEQIEADDATFHCPLAPPAQIYIPAKEQRSFQMAYRIGANQKRPRLAYAAVTDGAGKVLTLKPITQALATSDKQPSAPRPAPMDEKKSAAPAAVAANTASNPPAQRPRQQKPDGDALPPGPRPHGEAQGLAGVGLKPQQVNDAIDRGARGLWQYAMKKCSREHKQFGEDEADVLCALALVHADAHHKIPGFATALRAYLDKVDPHTFSSHTTYRAALLCMLIQAYGDPMYEPKMREAARWLLEAEGADGSWTYNAQLPETLFNQTQRTNALQISGGEAAGQASTAWTRLTPWKRVDGDNSCTQFAVLGLQSAVASGIQIPNDAWQKTLDLTLKRHCKDGGWHYHNPENHSYGSMTSAGICGAAIARYRLGHKTDFADDPTIQQGLGWLDRNFAFGKHPGYSDEKGYVFYYTYSIERVGRILDTEFIGIHEWYPEGARWLVDSQRADGTWQGLNGEEKGDPRLPTSFALLFLTRATPPLEPIKLTGPGTLLTDVVAPDNRFYIILDCSGSMIELMDGQVKFDIARNAVRSLVDKLPPNCEVALRAYGHRKSALDKDCDLDTELKIQMEPLDKAKFNDALDSLRARGKTPLALSIEEAIKDLSGLTGDKPVTVVLLTDGGEDTIRPRGNPLKAADDFGQLKNVRFEIVGFDINQQDWSQQLQEMSQRAHGIYWPAARSADLQRSIINAVLGVPEEFTVLDANGKVVTQGHFGEPKKLPEGKYTLRTEYAGRTFNQEFHISPGGQTSATFDVTQITPGLAGEAHAQTNANTAATPNDATKPWPKFCTHCGAPLQPGQKFCTHCGQPVVVK